MKPSDDRAKGSAITQRPMGSLSHSLVVALPLCAAAAGVVAQPGHRGEVGWPPTSDALEACIIAEEMASGSGLACIGREARRCLEIAQREPIVHAEKCYEPEVAAWARLANRYFHERPKGEAGKRIADVQKAWLGYRRLKCDYASFHHGGDVRGRAHALMCLMDETGRRAIELRSFRGPR